MRKGNAMEPVKKGTRKVEPETIIVRLAREGKLAAVGKKAAAEAFSKGIPGTRLEGQNIMKLFPDGSREILKPIGKL